MVIESQSKDALVEILPAAKMRGATTTTTKQITYFNRPMVFSTPKLTSRPDQISDPVGSIILSLNEKIQETTQSVATFDTQRLFARIG